MIREWLPNGQIRVTMDNDDATTAGTIAIAYELENLRTGWKPNRGFQGNPWKLTRDGLIAEYATALALGVPWDPPDPGNFDAMDIGGFYQVKSTPYARGRLMVDWNAVRVEGVYILVTGAMPVYIVRGWIWGHAAKQARYLWKPREDRPEQVFVPQSDLNRMDLIPAPFYYDIRGGL